MYNKEGQEANADNVDRIGANDSLRAQEQGTPDMTVLVKGGFAYFGSSKVEISDTTSPTFSAPGSDNRIDLLYLDDGGSLNIKQGTAAASPTQPSIPGEVVPICYVYLRSGSTEIHNDDTASGADGTESYIHQDVRPLVAFSPLEKSEADTLTEGSNADSLHKHKLRSVMEEEDWGVLVGHWEHFYKNADEGEVQEYGAVLKVSQSPGTSSGTKSFSTYSPNSDFTSGILPGTASNDEDFKFKCNLVVDSHTNGHSAIWGVNDDDEIGHNPISTGYTDNHIAFILEDGEGLHASVAGAGTQNTTTITGYTLSNFHKYEIEYDSSAGEAKFYVDDNLEATLSSNLPSSPLNENLIFATHASDSGESGVDFTVGHSFFLAVKLAT